ncbi:MAG: glycine/sarcosine/betaine reductase selenoprotein B family protein [Myxococcota bacterium]|nr:glycine/sarcosine/betaine reductase selenoprotein B family protein [Myxococcota bacterium]
MAEPVDYIDYTRRTYDALGYTPYAWVKNEAPSALAPLPCPLPEASLTLIASGGIYRQGQRAFHFKDDSSYRLIDTDVPMNELRVTHFAYDVSDARSDPNVVFPLEGLRQMVSEKRLGRLTPKAITFMGGIYSARRVREDLAPQIVQEVRDQRADIALLVPV